MRTSSIFAQEKWQSGPKWQPNGAILPTFHFQFRSSGEKLTDAHLVVIDEVELMDRVPPEIRRLRLRAECWNMAASPASKKRNASGICRTRFKLSSEADCRQKHCQTLGPGVSFFGASSGGVTDGIVCSGPDGFSVP